MGVSIEMFLLIFTVVMSAIVIAGNVLMYVYRTLFKGSPTIPNARVVKMPYRANCSRCGYTYDRDLGQCLCTWIK